MHSETFVRWAMDDGRTVEERYSVELLIERCDGRWKALHNIHEPLDWQVEAERKRQRKLNPAYQPQYSEEVVRRITEVFPEVVSWSEANPYGDRPQRDIKVLRFLPNLVEVGVGVETTDLSPLLELPKLRKLSVAGGEGKDYRVVGQCRQLRELSLRFSEHWPEVAGLENLTELEVLTLEGNLLVFERGLTFPKVVRGTLSCSPLAARCVRDLPQLPACQLLTLSGVDRLDGIEAFPELRNLTLQCDVRDYDPLAELAELTCLSCTTAKPLDVAPLVKLPKLLRVSFSHNYKWDVKGVPPRDYASLVECPVLRQLEVPNCAPVATEVAAVNAVLPPWDDLFMLAEPQALPPLRIISAPVPMHPRGPEIHLMPGETIPIDEKLRFCEARWVGKQMERNVRKRLGVAEWGTVQSPDYQNAARLLSAEVESFAVVEKLGLIVEALREVLAQLKPEYRLYFCVRLKAPQLEPTPEQREMEAQFKREREEYETEKHQREREEQLDRLHRFQLKKQEGGMVKPEEFAAPRREPPPPAPWDREDEDEEDEDKDEDGGGVAVKKRPDPPPSFCDDEHPLADNYRMWGVLTLTELWLTADSALISYVMGRAPDVVMERPPQP